MHSIFLPEFTPRTKIIDGKPHIYDSIRKQYVALTPEEMVRQSFIHYLLTDLDYPRSLITVEREVKLGRKANRSDIRVHTNDGHCFMLIECKSFRTRINQQVFDQAAKYSSQLKAKYVVVTNGVNTFCCILDHTNKDFTFLDRIPAYR